MRPHAPRRTDALAACGRVFRGAADAGEAGSTETGMGVLARVGERSLPDRSSAPPPPIQRSSSTATWRSLRPYTSRMPRLAVTSRIRTCTRPEPGYNAGRARGLAARDRIGTTPWAGGKRGPRTRRMIESRLRRLWEQVSGKKPHLPHFLHEVQLRGIRGITKLRVPFEYPVSVLAGANGAGKTTVLFAAACGYRVPDSGPRDFRPSTLFPDYLPKQGRRRDERRDSILHFDYSTPTGRMAMQWKRRSKGWNRSFLGRKGAVQPRRPVFLRTLSNPSNPSEVRGVLRMSRLRTSPAETLMTASQVHFAQQILPFRYSQVVDLSSGHRNLLFAEQTAGATYSELHMASGERTVLRLSQEVAQLRQALVLIDQVEAGLHPWVQQLLMLQLQQTALLNDLQLIVTTHSPSVLDCVPPSGRIFLDRDAEGQVSVVPPYRDLVQNTLYGRLGRSLNLLCEDDAAEGIVRGLLDILLPREGIPMESVQVGRDTGADEFPAHAAAFRKFGQIDRFVFVLDGNTRDGPLAAKIRRQAKRDVPVLFLPGNGSPEEWIWSVVSRQMDAIAERLGAGAREFSDRIQRLDSIYDAAADKPSVIAKHKLFDLATFLHREAVSLCRIVVKVESESQHSEAQPLLEGLHEALMTWRQP